MFPSAITVLALSAPLAAMQLHRAFRFSPSPLPSSDVRHNV
jgi:hypothetical protein